jgi:2-keto-4-pentenoate hydratase
MRAQLEARRAALDAGAEPLGWKIGINVPAVQERLGIDEPVVGFMTSWSLVEAGGSVDVGDWNAPVVEPEVAIRVGAGGTIAAVAPAIELVDIDLPFDDIEPILAGNIFHRHVVLGEEVADVEPAGRCRVLVDGEEVAAASVECDAEGTVAHVAEFLERHGARLTAGDLIIAGSLTAPQPVPAGARIEAEVGELGAVSVGTS